MMGRFPSGPSAILSLVVGIVLAAGCGGAGGAARSEESAPGLAAAAARVVTITTTPCGYAPPSDGFGIVLSPDRVLTVAHVIAGATDITVSAGDGGPARPATVVAYDPGRDLALLEPAPPDDPGRADPIAVDRPPPALVLMAEGDAGVIVGPTGGAADLPFSVAEKMIIEMDEVRGTGRTRRSGYRLDAITSPGDSGRGLYDRDGRLAGVLFAVSTDDRTRSWAVAADEIEAFLADGSVTGSFSCDAEHSRLRPDPT